ncbi:uncharacterized protein LOC127877988 [Dreissena polymorpha]|uniref:Uncharacterized protein n=1 Tax=Dreissena polymorpha TaxID=45954 RepID=A0A9D4LJZ5_DREPO|nr:uncharacterized protein LOC127839116 [Dreissena polymorpha]XP_052237189.1 uncharacterized protein LOC127848643 [Dreissena polymorpha]XP_052246520.1 uncharacterized protein LOC127855155 [Dreissena polymorpha]XP_052270643.1 uncharacterized protein LOC127871591 [Dreissena polymorpha]XP_052278680.1 uncharacterized protein LOC127877087 [Dreissena polymorpha]XP_052280298.1 uncharacterized protein LOC127877988 [Dreissena polymorpha]KAH3858221.1 hypothetical protein DPMN_100841 [Dreissena polymorp
MDKGSKFQEPILKGTGPIFIMCGRVCEEMSCEQSPVRISYPESHFDNVYSQSSQTSEMVVFRPTEHKGFTVKPQGKDSPILSTRLDTMWLKQLKRIALMTMLMN